MNNFIYTKKNAFTQYECDMLINLWERSEKWKGPSNRFERGLETYYEGVRINANSGFWTEKLHFHFKEYIKKHPFLAADAMDAWGIENTASIKKFDKGRCYDIEHCEHSSQTPHRTLVWMVYLNTVKRGGETFWPQFNYKSKSQMGKIVIWPAAWPWSHIGLVANHEEKYIFGGWSSFKVS